LTHVEVLNVLTLSDVPAGADIGDLDPNAVSSRQELAELLRKLHIRAGQPSLRRMQIWAQEQQRAGRSHIQLTKTTTSEVLAGRRMPSAEFLTAFLEACGVTGDAQQPWLAARAEIIEQDPQTGRAVDPEHPALPHTPDGRRNGEQADASPDASRATDQRPTSGPPVPMQRRKARRWVVVSVGLVALALLLTAALVWRRSEKLGTTLTCVSQGCATANKELALRGRVTGDLPSGREVQLLIRVDGTMRWYLGPAIVPDSENGRWSVQFLIGNPVPQLKDRHFMVCAFLLRSSSVEEFSKRQEFYAGEGVPIEEFPPDRKELECIPAVRRANT
jgi:hypothetical protein